MSRARPTSVRQKEKREAFELGYRDSERGEDHRSGLPLHAVTAWGEGYSKSQEEKRAAGEREAAQSEREEMYQYVRARLIAEGLVAVNGYAVRVVGIEDDDPDLGRNDERDPDLDDDAKQGLARGD